ncbi:MAG TPA: hypothetical protein PK156_42360, partial [Polyangium sp.]|nr:hypothetical protein [Polyangium sp.]
TGTGGSAGSGGAGSGGAGSGGAGSGGAGSGGAGTMSGMGGSAGSIQSGGMGGSGDTGHCECRTDNLGHEGSSKSLAFAALALATITLARRRQ